MTTVKWYWTKLAILTCASLLLAGGCAAYAQTQAPAAKSGEPQPLVYANYSTLPDGPMPDRFDSRNAASLAPAADPSWLLRIVNGRLTFAPTTQGHAAGYLRTPDLGSPITRMGMEWVVDPGLGGGPGVVAMGITTEPVDPVAARGGQMSMHFLARRDIWNFSVSPGAVAGDPRLITIGEDTFDPPLAEDGVTEHRVDVEIDGSKVTLCLPDGSVTQLSDPRIAAWAGRFGFFEAYAESGVNDGRVGIVKVWADT